MIKYTKGNLLEAPTETLVNTVNTQGIMGKGIALQFKQAFPEMFKAYAQACKQNEIELGKVHVHDLGGLVGGPKWIINFPTKGHWKSKSKITDIESGLDSLLYTVKRLGIRSIAIPPLGCGNGGLEWLQVKPLIENAFKELSDVDVWVFPPEGAPAPEQMINRTAPPQMTVGRAALIVLMNRYLEGLLDPFVSLLEIHKLMYFMQEAGQDLKLDFTPHRFGPYAQNLRHVMIKLEGHYLSGYGDGEDTPSKLIEILEQATPLANDFLEPHPEIKDKMNRVTQLISGYESPYGLELLSTVHWVMCHTEGAKESLEVAIDSVHNWSDYKRDNFKKEHIQKAWDHLKHLNWDTKCIEQPIS